MDLSQNAGAPEVEALDKLESGPWGTVMRKLALSPRDAALG
jgi:hypothetical protein